MRNVLKIQTYKIQMTNPSQTQIDKAEIKAQRMRENSRKYYEKNRERIIARIKTNTKYNNYPSKYIV